MRALAAFLHLVFLNLPILISTADAASLAQRDDVNKVRASNHELPSFADRSFVLNH